MSFKASVSLLIFCLYGLSIDSSEVLKSPTIIVLLLISPFIFNICFMYLGAPVLGTYMLTSVVFSFCIDPRYVTLSFVKDFVLKCILCDKSIVTPAFLLFVCMKYVFPSPHFQSVCGFSSEVSLF